MNKTLLFALLLSALPLQAAAKDNVVAACTFQDGKQFLLLKQHGTKHYRYHFGTPQRWEQVFSDKQAELGGMEIHGPCIEPEYDVSKSLDLENHPFRIRASLERDQWKTLDLKNGQYSIRVYFVNHGSFCRDDARYDIGMTLTVSRKGETPSEHKCDLSLPHTINDPLKLKVITKRLIP